MVVMEPPFLPLDSKVDRQINHNTSSIGQFLTREHASYVYKKVETGEEINADTIQQEMEQEEQLNKIHDMSGGTNLYQELTVNNAEKIEPLMTQMEQWSILSNILNYIQQDRHHAMNHTLNIKAMNKYRNNPETKEEEEFMELDFGSMPHKLHKEYLDIYEGIQSEIVNTMRFDENSDLSTTYLGKSDKTRNEKLEVEESFPISEHGYTLCKLLDGTKCQLLLDTGASKSFMSKSFYMHTCNVNHSILCPNLHQKCRAFKWEMANLLVSYSLY